jgi:hypothetical protein
MLGASLALAGGCSLALQPTANAYPGSPKPTRTPVVIDTVFATAAGGLAVAAFNANPADSLGLNNFVGALLLVEALRWALSALYGYTQVSAQEKNDALAWMAGRAPTVAAPMAPPGITRTCEQRRDAILAAASAAARDEMQAVTVRDLPLCDVP